MRQLYPILLWISIALAVGVYLHPKEARKCLQLGSQWGAEVLEDILRAACAFAEEPGTVGLPRGYLPAGAYATAPAGSAAATSPRVLAGPGQAADYPAYPVYDVAPLLSHDAAPPRSSPIRDAYPQQQTGNPLRPSMARAAPWLVEQPNPPGAGRAPSAAPPSAGPPPDRRPEDQPIPPGAKLEGPDPVADLTLCEGAQVLARVGSEVVLGSEVMPKINEKLSTVKGIEKIPADQLEKQREMFVRQLLQSQIDLKLIYVDAKRALPPEAIENINKQLSKRFEEIEVTNRMKELKLGSRRELEAQLGQWGTSLEREKRAFIEKAIAQQWVFETLRKEDEQFRHEELLAFYQEHAAEYEHPTRVRWEHLEVKFSRHPDKREAWQLIAAMGNEVVQGRPFADVARQWSEGATASRGGQRDWITQGSLKSGLLDQTLFSLPPGRLSRILEDEEGFHIVRVVEREDAYRTPFEEAQAGIREKLLAERKDARLKELLQRLRAEIPVWTVFDEETADSRGNDVPNRF